MKLGIGAAGVVVLGLVAAGRLSAPQIEEPVVLFHVRAVLSAVLLVAAFTALLSVLSLTGRRARRVSPRSGGVADSS